MIVLDPCEIFRPIEPGADVPFALDDDVVMPGPSFLSFPVPNPFPVEGAEVSPVHIVKAPGGFFVALYVIGKGQGQEGTVFYSVEAAKSLHVAG